MCSKQPAFEERGYTMDAWQEFHGNLLALAFEPSDGVRIAQLLQALIRSPSIGVNRASRSNCLLDEPVQAGSRAVGNSPETDSTNAPSVLLCRDRNHRFAYPVASICSGSDSSNEGFIHFDRPPEAVPSRADHGSAQLVKPTPGRSVTAQS